MKKKYKMTIGAVLFFLLYGVAGKTNLFAQTFTMNNLKYSVKSDGSVAIIGHSHQFTTGTISIDGYVTYNGNRYTVTEIGTEAFTGCYNANSIHIPGTVKTIGNYAFYNNKPYLTSIVIAEGVRSIGDHAFDGCEQLTSISIPNSVTSLGTSAFNHCSELKSIKIPDGVTEIGRSTFCGCMNLTSITIPSSVTTIGFDAFCHCTSLTSIIIPCSVTSVATYAFRLCENLTSVIIQNPNLQIDFEEVFKDCKKLKRSNVIYASGSGTASKPGSVSKPTSAQPKVYSNAYDGFVNIRQTPQSKAPILGVLRNGPEGAILLGTEGEWKKINCNGIVGYVYEKYVQDTPTEVFHGE